MKMVTRINQIEFNDVQISMGAKIICQQLNLTMKAGEVWGLLGPNGCGKSTLLQTITGLHPLKKGRMLFGQHDSTSNQIKLAKHIGILFQEMTTMFSQTVRDYCACARFPHLSYFQKYSAQDEQIIQDALQLFELEELQYKSITQLSGGQKRRAALAALLIQTPDIYLLDEPANHLDLRHQVNMFNHFNELAHRQSALVIMALHDVNQAQQYCDKIILMFPNGEIVFGNKDLVLTTTHLSKLYNQSLACLSWNNELFWKVA